MDIQSSLIDINKQIYKVHQSILIKVRQLILIKFANFKNRFKSITNHSIRKIIRSQFKNFLPQLMRFSFIVATALLSLGCSSNKTENKPTESINKIEGTSSVLVYASDKRNDDYNYSQELLNRFKHILPHSQQSGKNHLCLETHKKHHALHQKMQAPSSLVQKQVGKASDKIQEASFQIHKAKDQSEKQRKQKISNLTQQNGLGNQLNILISKNSQQNKNGPSSVIDTKIHTNIIGKQQNQNRITGHGNTKQNEICQTASTIKDQLGDLRRSPANLIAGNSYSNKVQGQKNQIKSHSHHNIIKGSDNIIGKNSSQNSIIGKGNIIGEDLPQGSLISNPIPLKIDRIIKLKPQMIQVSQKKSQVSGKQPESKVQTSLSEKKSSNLTSQLDSKSTNSQKKQSQNKSGRIQNKLISKSQNQQTKKLQNQQTKKPQNQQNKVKSQSIQNQNLQSNQSEPLESSIIDQDNQSVANQQQGENQNEEIENSVEDSQNGNDVIAENEATDVVIVSSQKV